MPKRRNSKKGGMNSASPSSYSDAASYALKTAGPTAVQWDNVFKSSNNNHQGNGLVGLQGQRVGGGRRSRSRSKSRSRRRSQKGGFFGIISKALTPFTLLAMQQTYRRKNSGNQTRRRH